MKKMKKLNNDQKFIFSCIVVVLFNVLMNRISVFFNWDLPLDSMGTMIMAMAGGYFPGILVAFFTNLVEVLWDPTMAYVMVIDIIIATLTTYFYKKGYFKKVHFIVLFILIAAVVGNAVELMLAMENGAGIGNVYFDADGVAITDEELKVLYNTRFLHLVLDRTICLIGALIVLHFMHPKAKVLIRNFGWKQRPISDSQMKKISKNAASKKSINNRIVRIVSVVIVAITIMFIMISHVLFTNMTRQEYADQSVSYASLVADEVDGNMVNQYLEFGSSVVGYMRTQKSLERIYNSSEYIAYIYVYQVQEDGCHVIFDLDTEDVPADKLGDVVELDAPIQPMQDELIAGTDTFTYEDNSKYGHLMTTYVPIRDNFGKIVCYACVDIDLEHVNVLELNFLHRMITLAVGFLIFVIAWVLWLSKYNIVFPINSIVHRAKEFDFSDEDARRKNMEKVRDLNIQTGTEIESLYFAFLQVVEESLINFSYLQVKSEQMNQLQMGLIYVMADLVENRDSSTGDHIRKTAAYVAVILKKMKELGYYEDKLTEIFIEDCVKSAPLHDIGKIQIPDAILNKPGKLTDEEFEIMKTHAQCGADIIQQVIDTLPNSQYLYEAKRIAGYHHEKWNGTGYPKGLKEEEIPLSARVMAVADVFDALVSVRVYKKSFSFDEAMAIIKKDAGTHFDPLVADAFIQASDEVKKISEEFAEGFKVLED